MLPAFLATCLPTAAVYVGNGNCGGVALEGGLRGQDVSTFVARFISVWSRAEGHFHLKSRLCSAGFVGWIFLLLFNPSFGTVYYFGHLGNRSFWKLRKSNQFMHLY